jgi:4a-hydroxytetrahydrobiopterin dehydratase
MDRSKLDPTVVDAWLPKSSGWQRAGQDAIRRSFTFPDFTSALAFVVKLGCAAEKRDHHPEIELGWGKATVTWSTHDAGGITQLDLDLAEATNRLV